MTWKRLDTSLRRTTRAALVAGAAAVVMGGTALLADQGNAGAQSQARTLAGTWRVEITVRHCHTGAAVMPAFPAMATFATGGTVTTSDGGLSPLARGAGHGVWRHTGAHSYEALTEAFLFTPAGTLGGRQRLRQFVELGSGADEFASSVLAEILDAQGTVIGAGCATSVGRRLD
jgi:hypothetical protein